MHKLDEYVQQGTVIEEGSAFDAVVFHTSLLVEGMLINYALVNKEHQCAEMVFASEDAVRAALYAKEVGELISVSEGEAALIAYHREQTEDKEEHGITLQ